MAKIRELPQIEFNRITHTSNVKGAVNYTMKGPAHNKSADGKRYELASGIGCTPHNAIKQMNAVFNNYHISYKRKKIQRHVQSFNPQIFDYRNPKDIKRAHQIGVATAKALYPGHQCLVVTQIDTTGKNKLRKRIIHNHILVNMINSYTGKSLNSKQRNFHWVAPMASHVGYVEMGMINGREPTINGREPKNKVSHAEWRKTHVPSKSRDNYSWVHDLKNQLNQYKHEAYNIKDYINKINSDNKIQIITKTRKGRSKKTYKYKFIGEDTYRSGKRKGRSKHHSINGRKLGSNWDKAGLIPYFKIKSAQHQKIIKAQQIKSQRASQATHEAKIKASSLSSSRSASASISASDSASMSISASISIVASISASNSAYNYARSAAIQSISEDKATWPSKSASMSAVINNYFNSSSISTRKVNQNAEDSYNKSELLRSSRERTRMVSKSPQRNLRPVKDPRLKQAVEKSKRQVKARSIRFPKETRAEAHSPLDDEIQEFSGQVPDDESNVKQQQEATSRFQVSFRPVEQKATTLSTLFGRGWHLIKRAKQSIKRAKQRIKGFAKRVGRQVRSFADRIKDKIFKKHQRAKQRKQDYEAKHPLDPLISKIKSEVYIRPGSSAVPSSSSSIASSKVTAPSSSSTIMPSSSQPSVISEAQTVTNEIDLTKGLKSSSSKAPVSRKKRKNDFSSDMNNKSTFNKSLKHAAKQINSSARKSESSSSTSKYPSEKSGAGIIKSNSGKEIE